jgi:hypothetical protein
MSAAYFDKKGTFHGTIEDLTDKVAESIQSWTQEERDQFRRDVVRDLNHGRTAEGEWIS